MTDLPSPDVTRLLRHLADGRDGAYRDLIEAVYDELRELATRRMRQEPDGISLDATGLVHEVFMRMHGDNAFESRRHFFGAACEAMRRILVEKARSRQAAKRGGGRNRREVDWAELAAETLSTKDWKLEQLDLALDRLETQSPDRAEVVKLRYFAGLTIRETADVIGISTATAERHWEYARAWLQAEVQARSEK